MTFRGARHPRLKRVALLVAAAIACNEDTTIPPPPAGPDRSAPHPIDDLSLTYDSLAQTVVFAWTAPRDDELHDRADRYDIRYGGSFPFDWDQATRVTDPPDPLKAGTPQAFGLTEPRRGRDIYASMRAIDAAGNISPAGVVAHARIPGYWFTLTCIDALSDLPVEGLEVALTGRIDEHRTTPADGQIELGDLPGGALDIAITTGSAAPLYHAFADATTLAGDVSIVTEMIPFQQPDSPDFTSILHLLNVGMLSPGERLVRRWHSLPVAWYAREFVNVNGLDYRALTEQAAERWNTRLGFQLFAPVASDPAVGVLLEFLPRSTMGTTNGITEYENDANGYPVHDRIRIVDDFADGPRLYSVLMHELGHTIPLGHLGPGFIMYASQPLPSDITDDEVKMVHVMYGLPNGTALGKYDFYPPSP